MCGKFSQMASWQDVHAFSQPLLAKPGDAEVVATPMRFAQVMRLDDDGQRELVSMRWGFAGRNDPDPGRPKHMHARSETIDKLATFKGPFARGRGILLVHTFNEGEELASGKTKQWVITPNDGQPIAIAVICERWQNGPDALETFVQVTTPANTLISRITDRMPAILPRETWPLWLGEIESPLADVKAALRTFDDAGAWMMREQPTKARASKRKASPEPTLL